MLTPDQTIEVLGISQLHQYGAMTPSCQDKTDLSGVLTDHEDGGANLSPDTSTSIGQNDLNNMCNPPCTPPLQKSADGSVQLSGDPFPELRDPFTS